MHLKLFKSVWGMSGTWASKLQQISEAGYTGVECGMPTEEEEEQFLSLLEEYGLELILQIYTQGEHRDSFERQAERAATFHPLLINSHSAKDSMPYDAQLLFFERALEVEKQLGIPIGHETHRGRATFTPWSTARLLNDLPDLHIVADLSHWCCVCESMLADQQMNISLVAQQTIHVHGRVGYEEGPQVPDFRAPEYEYALARHELWWDEIVDCHVRMQKPFFTFTPEFGPPKYMHTLPFTDQPVVDLWEICSAMGQRFKERFESRVTSPTRRSSERAQVFEVD
ncbi:sugar phosphate isomerase/epimerase family protein [Alicyclobacillus fastidiosus]|uniref:TIM barrel protein n=1 Tax=Alicyclobacillus fastidiosus TaxID=392011 RepID=A0ABV5AB52_9BACL|nr:TIM barrel protein [Alicyclobacillus fastidiosus]WEH10533.1 TIM barrel protein [Alicyclobacillus fastidiosus]